ncbi:MAG: hypothetical protein C4523_12485 [Myxococcales bacterium]|nr:MAG: hypothetical protein C4523_12485 [Myxococcales bacterium]
MSAMHRGLFGVLAAAAILLAAACDEGNDYAIGMELVSPVDQDPFQGLSKLVFTVADANDAESQDVLEYNPSEGFSSLDVSLDLDYYAEFVAEAKGLGVEGETVACGRTPRITASLYDGASFAVWFSRPATIARPPFALDRPRAGLRLAMPNEADVVIVGGEARDKDGAPHDTVPAVGYLSPPTLTMDLLKRGEDTVVVGAGLVGCAAAVLDSQSVLAVGGYARSGEQTTWQKTPLVLSSADEEIVTAVELGVAFTPRVGHQAVSLGEALAVLVCGGEDERNQALDDCVRIDAGARKLTRAEPLIAPRAGHTQTALFDDDLNPVGVLVAGGQQTADAPFAEWRSGDDGASIPLDVEAAPALVGHAAVALDDGRVLIAGGRFGGAPTDRCWIFDSLCADGSCDAFGKPHACLTTPRSGHTLTAVTSKTLVACGGEGPEGSALADCEVLEDRGDEARFVVALPMTRARTGHDAIRLPDGTLLIAGGFNEAEGALDAVDILNPGRDWP